MIYVGHFSFMQEDQHDNQQIGENPYHGYFTTIAEAENIDSALEKFKVLLEKLKGERDVFEGINDVFLDICVECKTIPKQGFLAHFMEWEGIERGSISTAIRGATDEEVNAYSYNPDDMDATDDDSVVEPFISFNE